MNDLEIFAQEKLRAEQLKSMPVHIKRRVLHAYEEEIFNQINKIIEKEYKNLDITKNFTNVESLKEGAKRVIWNGREMI